VVVTVGNAREGVVLAPLSGPIGVGLAPSLVDGLRQRRLVGVDTLAHRDHPGPSVNPGVYLVNPW